MVVATQAQVQTQAQTRLGSTWAQLPAGTFWAGSDRHYPEESPRHLRSVGAFNIATCPVTNADFAVFVEATGYVSDAQRIASGAVFTPPSTDDKALSDGWAAAPDACWRKPDGHSSITQAHDDHPVVQVSLSDAQAFAEWAGARLPTEHEWEYAASRGQGTQEYIWGNQLTPNGERAANIWARGFPYTREAGLAPWGTTSVGCFAPNAAGLYDMIGNVWEWTTDPFTSSHRTSACCGTSSTENRVVIKGGSHLCSPAYCQRYRPAARHPFSADMSTNHLGFRLVWDVAETG